MAKVNQEFFQSYLYGKVLEAIKILSEVGSALDASETELQEEIKGILKRLTRLEI